MNRAPRREIRRNNPSIFGPVILLTTGFEFSAVKCSNEHWKGRFSSQEGGVWAGQRETDGEVGNPTQTELQRWQGTATGGKERQDPTSNGFFWAAARNGNEWQEAATSGKIRHKRLFGRRQ
jgi:hypothetical protein